jgi:hypothetical protein
MYAHAHPLEANLTYFRAKETCRGVALYGARAHTNNNAQVREIEPNPWTRSKDGHKGSRTQISLKLAWLLTVDRAQGVTFDKVCVASPFRGCGQYADSAGTPPGEGDEDGEGGRGRERERARERERSFIDSQEVTQGR